MKSLFIKNFKCFYKIEIPINNLTILAGGNGNGKSTIIQALLLLRRTIEHCSDWKYDHFEFNKINQLNVELNDIYCLGLGNSINILPSEFKDTEIEFGFNEEDSSLIIQYSTNNLNEVWITPIKLINNNFHYPKNPLMFQQFYYLNAERIGPRINQKIKFYDYPNVGFQGEFTAQIISDLDSFEIDSKFKIDTNRILNDSKYLKGNKFQHHVNAWLSYIFDGVTIIPIKDSETHTARIVVENSFSKGKSYFPTNTGFGISYSLPIIVSCLLAKKDTILIIENPEAHLHPSAQSKIGYFISIMANSGINIIVETHSDHIINGIQIAVAEQKIKNDLISINFLSIQENISQPEVNTIQLNKNGELSDWPIGFFDQTQIDFSQLIRIRKHV